MARHEFSEPKLDQFKILQDETFPLHQRVAAAEALGFQIIPRGPEDEPRKIVFRHPTTLERFTHMLPRGKRAYNKLRNEARRREYNLERHWLS